VGGGRSHDNTARERGTGDGRANGPSSPSDTAGENEHAVRLVGQLAVETGKDAGEISPGGTPARLRGGVTPGWVERRTSTKLDPGVTSRKTARIRDRVRTGSSAGRRRSRCRASAFFAAAESTRNVPRPVQSTGGFAEPIGRTLW
jgi:hypothetical protein